MGEAAQRKKRGEFPKPAEPPSFPPDGQRLRMSHVVVVASFDVVRDSDGKRVGAISTPNGGQKPEEQPWVMQEADVPEGVIEWLRAKMAEKGVKL